MEKAEVQKAKEAQLKAVTELLYHFAQTISKEAKTQGEMYELSARQAVPLCNLINAQTAASLVAMHTSFKETLSKHLNSELDACGKAIIDSFKSTLIPAKK